MKVSYKWLQTHIEEKLPAVDVLAEKITFHACEVEGVEMADADQVIDINVLPDRAPYLLSHYGIAGEIAAIFSLTRKNQPAISFNEGHNTSVLVRIDDQDLCSRYCTRYIKNITIAESPDSITQPLASVGQRAINLVVDVTNYVLFDVGQPLHAFDADKIKGTLVLRRARAGEKITLLDGREIALDPNMLLEADDEGPLAVAGIKGGKRAEITSETKNIILLGGNFNTVNVRATSTKLGIRSDASKRFENGLSVESAPQAIDQAAQLIADHSPGASIGPLADAYPKPIQQKVISARANDIVNVLGITISETEIISILERLYMKVTKQDETGDLLSIYIPSNRLDITTWRDIPEEIGRIYGYDKIKPTLPANTARTPDSKPQIEKTFYYAEKIKNMLVERGFSEVYTYSLVPKGVYEIEKPLAADKNYLRTNLSDGVMQSLVLNVRNADLLGMEIIRIFEIGKVFAKEGEHTSLCIGIKHAKKNKEKEKDRIKVVRDQILETLEAGTSILCTIDDTGGLIALDGQTIGVTNAHEGIMEINLDKLIAGLPQPVSYNDLHFSKAVSATYKKISSYPFIVRDIAVLVPESVTGEVLWSAIEKGIADIGLLARHSLFDVFKKDGKVSYAFRMVFQSMEKTLTDAEANSIMEKVNAKMKENGWEVR